MIGQPGRIDQFLLLHSARSDNWREMTVLAEGWHAGPRIEKTGRWTVEELGSLIPDLVKQAAPNALTTGEIPAQEVAQ